MPTASGLHAEVDSLLKGFTPSGSMPTPAYTDEPELRSPAEEQRGQNWYEGALDILARPNYMVANTARAAMKGGDLLTAAGRGLAGQDRTTFGDILREDFGWEGPGAGLVGFGLDVITDPTNLLGIGAATKVGKLASKLKMGHELALAAGDAAQASKFASELAAIGGDAMAGERALVSIAGHKIPLAGFDDAMLGKLDEAGKWFGGTPVGKKLGKMFVNKKPNETMRALEQSAERARETGIYKFSQEAKPYVALTRKVVDELGPNVNPHEVEEAIGTITELFVPTRLEADELVRSMDKATRQHFKTISGQLDDAKSMGGRVVDTSGLTKVQRTQLAQLYKMSDAIAAGRTFKYAGKVYSKMPGHALAKLRSLERRLPAPALSGQAAAPVVNGMKEILKRLRGEAQQAAEARQLGDTIKNVRQVYGYQANIFDPYARQMVTFLNTFNAGVLRRTRQAGITIEGLQGMGYLRHLVTPEARTALQQHLGKNWWKKYTEKHGAQLDRALKGLTVHEVNQLARKGKLPGFPGLKVDRFFESNPLVSTAFRAGEAERAIETAALFDKSVRLWGQKPKGMKPGQWPDGWVELQTDIPSLKGKRLPPEIGNHLNRTMEVLNNPDEFLTAWQQVNDVWKRYTLSVFPVYHTRNILGDFFNAVALGGTNPANIIQAIRVMSPVGAPAAITIGGKPMVREQLLEMAHKLGVMSGGGIDEFQRRTLQELGRKNAGVYENLAHNKFIDTAMRVGAFRENTTRLGMFIDRLSSGMAPEQAALEVKKFLFDYRDITDFEKGLVRSGVFPFYTWLRKNIPLQLEMLFAKPGVHAGIQHARDEAAGAEEGVSSELPGFLRQGVPTRAGTNPEGFDQYIPLRKSVPAADLTSLSPRGMIDEAMHSLGPLFQVPLEMMSGVDLSRSSLASGEGMQTLDRGGRDPMFSLFGAEIPSRLKPIVESIRAVTELNKLNPGDAFGTYGEPGPGGATRDYPDPEMILRILGAIIGRPYAVDDMRSSSMEALDRQREIETLLRAMQRAGGPEEQAALMRAIEEAGR